MLYILAIYIVTYSAYISGAIWNTILFILCLLGVVFF